MIEYPQLLWQHEHNSKWITYSYQECCILNKAFAKNQKTVTLPSKDQKKKLNINFNKMFQKNLASGYEQRVRCLIFNNSYFFWSWQDDFEDFISYSPRIVVYLEVALMKELNKVEILLKDEYEIDLHNFTQMNKVTEHVRQILRVQVLVDCSKVMKTAETLAVTGWNNDSKKLIKKMSEDKELCLKDILFGSSSAQTATTSFEMPSINDESISSSSDSTFVTPVAVDPLCPEAKNCSVYFDGEKAYAATLNLTNLQDNNNKFYNMQLLQYNHKQKFALWFHWGRVGYKGQVNLLNYNKNLEQAKLDFEKKFYDKTRNHFRDVKSFQRVPSKYDLVETDLSSSVSSPLPLPETQLDRRIQKLLEIICNKETLEAAAKDMLYDAKATPLGKITAKQIKEGYTALKNISDIIRSKGVGKDLIEACNVFYTKIPHDFGRKTPPVLRTLDDVTDKLKMLEALSNICLAMNIIGSTEGLQNPIDIYYKRLECNLVPLESDSEEFKALNKCLQETHGPSHAYKLEIIDAFKSTKDAQESNFLDFGNNKLLFHGSRTSNWLSILKKGLQIAPPEAPSTGYMFGKGVYFADISSKSANYCYPTKKKNEGLLQLSEVSLGKVLEVQEAMDLSDLPDEYQSAFGIGKIVPSFETNVLSSEASIPCGPLQERSIEGLSLNYNEYIVYNVQQIKMKYLLRIRFIFP